MEDGREKNLAAGIVAGLVGGLVASWLMDIYIEGAGQTLQRAVQTTEERQKADSAAAEQAGVPKEDATMKTADALVKAFTGRELSFEEKKTAGPIVHYTFGGLMGGVYGALAECSEAARSGNGTVFGAALFVGADLIAVPTLKLSGASGEYPISSYTAPFTAHLVYGAVTELVRRLVRSAL